jgi:hypothetical protein
MSFYVGSYLILSDTIAPKHDRDSWELPDTTAHSGHMADTSNVEELLIDPEDMDLIPTQIQFGCAEWTDDEGWTPDYPFAEFYVKAENFYVRNFSWSDQWSEFYSVDEAFYVRGFSPTDYWSEFYSIDEAFYVRGFSPTDYWSEFYMADEAFYVRNFTATPGLWTEFYAADFP